MELCEYETCLGNIVKQLDGLSELEEFQSLLCQQRQKDRHSSGIPLQKGFEILLITSLNIF
jgi:hypothetical protein